MFLGTPPGPAFSPFREWIHAEIGKRLLQSKRLPGNLRLVPSEWFRSSLRPPYLDPAVCRVASNFPHPHYRAQIPWSGRFGTRVSDGSALFAGSWKNFAGR